MKPLDLLVVPRPDPATRTATTLDRVRGGAARAIAVPGAPPPVGHYAPAVIGAGLIFASGQIAVEDADGATLATAAQQAAVALEQLGAVLAAAGAGIADVVRTTVYLIDLADFESVNREYARFFGDWRPAHALVQVSALALGARVEIDAIAVAPQPSVSAGPRE